MISCLILPYLIYSKYLDEKLINEFIANCKNKEYCIKDLSGVRISARGPMYWINIEKNIHYTLLFRENENGEIMLDDSLCWNDLSDLTNKQYVPNSFLCKVKSCST